MLRPFVHSRVRRPILLPAVPPSIGGTFRTLGTQTLAAYVETVRAGLPGGQSVNDTRLLPVSGLLAFCGATIWRDRYALPINGGHGDSSDDGGYAQNLATGSWETLITPSTVASQSASEDYTFGEYVGVNPANRPASQHSYCHNITVGDNMVQAFGYAVMHLAGTCKQAHRWVGVSAAWERYGTGGTSVSVQHFAHYDSSRNRIVRIPLVSNNSIVEWIADNDPTAAWTTINISVPGQVAADIYSSIGYHPVLDCYVLISPHDFTPTNTVYVMAAANISAGWTAVSVSGTSLPFPSENGGLEFIPPMNSFAMANDATSSPEPAKLYYLTPTGTRTDPWIWSSETFTGTTTAAAWEPVGINSKLRWSSLLNGLVAIKGTNSLTEVFTPLAVSAYLDWIARSTESGVIAAYDFSAEPANGGTYLWGSIQVSPKITVEVPDHSYDSTRLRDRVVYPPGSTASLRFDVPSGSGERGDQWRISIDDYAYQFGENSEFWVQWRQRMNATMATYQFKERVPGDPTSWDGFYTQAKHCFFGWGMQFPYGIEGSPATYYGYQGPTTQSDNTTNTTRTDCDGEIVMKYDDTGTVGGSNMKYPSMYFSKAFYGLQDRGQNINYYTQRNGGNDFTVDGYNGVRACEYFQSSGNNYTDRSTCFLYPTDAWTTLCIRVKLGPQGTALDNLSGLTKTGYINSIIEYYGQETVGGPMVLLHRRGGCVLTPDFSGDVGAQGIGRYGMFGWTTFMTGKMFETHPTASYWISQVIIKSGSVPPSAPRY